METKNESIPNEIVAATAAELSEESTACLKIKADYSLTNLSIEQKCLLCENTRVLPAFRSNIGTYICDECQEAIAYAKELMKHRGAELFYDKK